MIELMHRSWAQAQPTL